MIVKKGFPEQFSIFREEKPDYRNCKTCARLVPNGKCEYCGVNEYTTRTPWYRLDNIKTPKVRSEKKKLIQSIIQKYS